jgi:DNA-binding NarL/FixJ family response regulator
VKKRTRILLIEDNRLLREGITTALKGQADFRVVAASNGNRGLLLQVREAKPDVVLMDIGLRNQSGLRIVASLMKEFPKLKVIGMGLIPSQRDIVELVETGAAGFILKDATMEDVFETIRAVVRGMKILPPLLTSSLFSYVADHALRKQKGKLPEAVRMTKREREIIALIADGLSNKDIAQRLNIATFTVKSHVHNILEKLTLHSRLQISAYVHNEESL